MRRLFLGLVLPALLPLQAEAGRSELFEIGNWVGAAYFDDEEGGAFSYCAVASRQNDDNILYFNLGRDGRFLVSVRSPTFSFTRDQNIPARMSIDGHRFNGEGGAWAEDTASFELPTNEGNYSLLQRGNRAEFWIGGRTYSFSLRGSSRALDRLAECVAENNRSPASPPQGPVTGDRTAQRLEATTLLTNVIGGIAPAGFRIVTDGATRAPQPSDVAWISESMIGSVDILDTMGEMSMDEVAAYRSSNNSVCDAGVNVASKRDAINGVSVVTTMVDCRTEGKNPLVINRILVPRESGGYVEFAFGTVDREGLPDDPAVLTDRFRDAVYRQVEAR